MKVLDSAGFKTALTMITGELNDIIKNFNKNNGVGTFEDTVMVKEVNHYSEPIKLRLKFVRCGMFVDMYITYLDDSQTHSFIRSENLPSTFKPKNNIVTNMFFDEWEARLIRLFFDNGSWYYTSSDLGHPSDMIKPYDKLSTKGNPIGDGWMFITRYEVN